MRARQRAKDFGKGYPPSVRQPRDHARGTPDTFPLKGGKEASTSLAADDNSILGSRHPNAGFTGSVHDTLKAKRIA